MMVLALSHAQGTLLTIGLIVLLVLVFGVIVVSDNTDWFD